MILPPETGLPETMRETLRRSEGEMMAYLIRRARARWATLPQLAKDAYVRSLEDERAGALGRAP